MKKQIAGEGSLDLSDDTDLASYDKELTRELMSLFAAAGAVDIYVDPEGRDGIFLTAEKDGDTPSGRAYKYMTFSNGAKAFISRVVKHENHFHVKFPLTNPPATFSLSSTAESMPADGKSAVTLTSDGLIDKQGWILLQGTSLIVTVTNQQGNPIGFLSDEEGSPHYRGGRRISLTTDGKLNFTYRAGLTPGVATIRVYADHGKEKGPDPNMLLSEKVVTLTAVQVQ